MECWFSFLSIFILMLHRDIFCVNTRFEEHYSWKYLDFQFPNERIRKSLIDSREYIPTANVPVGMAIWFDKFFISVPRMIPGIISTLNYFDISDTPAGSSPRLIPYPNFEMTRIRRGQTDFNSSIISVFRMKVDACDRLWFIDVGFESITKNAEKLAPPRLFIIDLRTDRIIEQYQFDTSVAPSDSVMGGNIEVDVTADTCGDAFAYIPDFNAYRLVVYSYEKNVAWRIDHPYFHFDPFASLFYIDDLALLWTTGVFSATLSPMQSDGFRILYFTSIPTTYQFAVSTRYLKDSSRATNASTLIHAYRFLGTRGPNMQITDHIIHEPTGTLFYTLVNQHGVGCWNSKRFPNKYTPSTNFILATDDITMTFNNDIMYDDFDNIWVLSDLFPVSNHKGLKEDQVNFRIFVAPVKDLIRGTICEYFNDSNNNRGFFHFPSNSDSKDPNFDNSDSDDENFENSAELNGGSFIHSNPRSEYLKRNYNRNFARNLSTLFVHGVYNSGL